MFCGLKLGRGGSKRGGGSTSNQAERCDGRIRSIPVQLHDCCLSCSMLLSSRSWLWSEPLPPQWPVSRCPVARSSSSDKWTWYDGETSEAGSMSTWSSKVLDGGGSEAEAGHLLLLFLLLLLLLLLLLGTLDTERRSLCWSTPDTGL